MLLMTLLMIAYAKLYFKKDQFKLLFSFSPIFVANTKVKFRLQFRSSFN